MGCPIGHRTPRGRHRPALVGTGVTTARCPDNRTARCPDNYQLPITKWPRQSGAPVGAAPPTRSQLRLQRHTQVPVQNSHNGCQQPTLNPVLAKLEGSHQKQVPGTIHPIQQRHRYALLYSLLHGLKFLFVCLLKEHLLALLSP